MSERRFEYKLSVFFVIFASVLFGGLTALIGSVAIMDGSVHVWILTAIMGALFVASLYLLVKTINTRQELVLTDRQIKLITTGAAKKELTVDFDKVTDIKFYDFRNVTFFDVIHKGGSFRITAGMLPSGEDFEFIANYIDERRPEITA